MSISDFRDQIDHIDEELVRLFIKRMEVAAQVADYKKAHNLPVYVPAREENILQKVTAMSGQDLAQYVQALYAKIFELSRDYQNKCNK